ncbi:zf-HC2 domain-containing protein [Desulfobacterales bacterium HSG2]|nr:zf-HC2 domain-containing protein [Desulfobacterales bacterium HSG2]
MNKSKCDPILLSQFFDHELEPEEYDRVSEHVRDCLSCRKSLLDNQSLSGFFRAGLGKTVARTRFDNLEERVLSQVRNRKPQIGNWKFLIPAAAMVAILFLVFPLTGPRVSVSGPSAIVESLTGDTSSVMILETPESRQTIIWFNETLISEDEKNEVQETDHTSIIGCSDRRAGRAGPVRT